MKASRLAIPPGQSLRLTESSTTESFRRRSKSSTSSSKRKQSSQPSTSKSRNRCPPVLCTQLQAAEDSFVHATANADVHPLSSDSEQAANSQNLPDCESWPNWLEWGSDTNSCAAGPSGAPNYSDTSSSCSYSDYESDLRWSALASSDSRANEPRQWRNTCSFWEDFIWGEHRPWRKLRHKRSFVTRLWDFKPETKVEEISDPILVSVNVLGSPGPLRLVVDRNDSVQHTVDFSLRIYTAQKRQPAFVDPTSCFGLYCLNPDFEALDDEAKIGHRKNRQFHVYHKQRKDLILEDVANNDSSLYESDGTTKLAPIRTWIWDKLNGMRSWAENLVAGISRSTTFWVKYLNPGRFYAFMYLASVKALSVGSMILAMI